MGASAASVAASSAPHVVAGVPDSAGDQHSAAANAASRAGRRNYSTSAASSTQTRLVFHES